MNNLDRIYTEDIEKYSCLYFSYLKEVIDSVDVKEIRRFTEIILDARRRSATVFFIGNGGSAATASHFANDLAIGVNEYEKPFKVLSLTDNISVLTAVGNDNGYEEIFVRQLKVYGNEGDVLVGISASGNSLNLIRAFNYAENAGIKTVSLTAFDGGELKIISDHCVHIPTEDKEYGPAEDLHMILDHLIGSYLIRLVKGEKD